MTEQVDLDMLIAEARATVNRGWFRADYPSLASVITRLADALESTLAELRQERERADEAEYLADVRRKTIVTYMRENADWELRAHTAERSLSRAEGTIVRIRVARGNHPECDVHDADDPVTCGWKRAVQDIDVALTEYDKQKEADRG